MDAAACSRLLNGMAYHITGLISAVIFLLTVSGLWSQLQSVWQRRHEQRDVAGFSTAVLSLNQFLSSFLAFFSFFLYGMCLNPFNHYLVWPRLIASVLTLGVLYEIMRDRKRALPTLVFLACTVLLLGAPLFLILNPQLVAVGRRLSQGLILTVTVVLAQGYSHQILLIRQSGQTGAVSLRLHQFFFLKDASTIAFALAMGLAGGWPLLLLSSVSGLTKLAAMWHFRWARLSPVARERRESRLAPASAIQGTSEETPAFPTPTA
jgi:uncharacterized protein with PQ loop repeat